MPPWHPPVVFAVAALVTYGLDLWLLQWFRDQRVGSAIRKQGPETHQAKAKTPALGGAAFPVAYLLAMLVAVALLAGQGVLDLRSPGPLVGLALLLFLPTASFLIGFADDYAKVTKKSSEGLKARYKFPLQLLLGAILAYAVLRTYGNAYGMVLPFPDMALRMSLLLLLFVVLYFSGTINAVNFTDGLDGLLAGTGTVALLVVAGLGYGWFPGQPAPIDPLVGHAALAGAGTLAGFYPLNRHPAKLFMGDGGAYFIGGLMATVTVLQGTPFLFLIIGAVFYLEILSVMLQVAVFRATKGKRRLFPMTPLHHSFEVKGWPEERVVALFWFAGLLFAVLGIGLGRAL
ncbi:MAG TPA: phospho-N-acetylmuramoyl-pentapeptide-transferase [bacterium]|nr:phospho-N-acetylmuramoyl-pentapeptide-transferase [bacterium]